MTAQQFRDIRHRAGMTLRDVGKLIGWDTRNVRRIESGYNAISPRVEQIMLDLEASL